MIMTIANSDFIFLTVIVAKSLITSSKLIFFTISFSMDLGACAPSRLARHVLARNNRIVSLSTPIFAVPRFYGNENIKPQFALTVTTKEVKQSISSSENIKLQFSLDSQTSVRGQFCSFPSAAQRKSLYTSK